MQSCEAAEDNIVAIKSAASTLLDLPPSCMEFAPSWHDYFVVGTYHLQQNESVGGAEERNAISARSGSLILFHLQGHGDLSLCQTIPTPFAVLDLRFSEWEPWIFAIAASNGSVHLYALEPQDEQKVSMRNVSSISIDDPSLLVLSLAWSTCAAEPSTLAISLSDGRLGILNYKSPNSSLNLHAHSLEAWTVAWSRKSCNDGVHQLYSGGDDSSLCTHRLACSLAVPESGNVPAIEASNPTAYDNKTHSAGVTAILPIATDTADEQIVLTGSYDEFLRVLLPATQSKRSTLLAKKRLGGGIWRLKLLSPDELAHTGQPIFKVLASCMHAGVRVVEVSRRGELDWTIRVVASFEEHESMNYASDACMKLGEDGVRSTKYVSTSFYDRKLCVWKIKDD